MERLIDPIESVDEYEEKSRRVLVWGATLFLVGMAEGIAIPWFANPRMGLSAHLAGVQGGMALLIIGLAWHRLRLSIMQLRLTYWSTVAGMVLIWVALTLAAVLGTSNATPIAGAGFNGSAAAETLVTGLLYIGSAASLIGGGLFFWGLELTTARNSRLQ